jgi:glyoxylase-like metal-dependent hydrolase (beta-lactamase superfamily II)
MRSRALATALLVWTLAAGVHPAAAQNDHSVKVQDLGQGLSLLMGRGGNVAVLLGPDGVLLVDDQYADSTPEIRAAITKLGGGPVRFVLNTHWHGDHTGGNESWAGTGAVIVAHDNVRARMGSEQWNPLRQATTPASPPAALPIVTFADGIRFHLNGQQIDVKHVDPAHTDGDAIVAFREAKVLHLGDTYFNGLYPYIDVASGGSIDGMLAAVDRVLAAYGKNVRIIPGHGPLSNTAELRVYREMLAGVRDGVKKGIAEGKTVDEIVASRPTAAFDAKWGGGFMTPENFVRIVYAGMTRAE